MWYAGRVCPPCGICGTRKTRKEDRETTRRSNNVHSSFIHRLINIPSDLIIPYYLGTLLTLAPSRPTFYTSFSQLSNHTSIWLYMSQQNRKWFEPSSYILWWNLIVHVKVVLGETVGGDWYFIILSGGRLQSQVPISWLWRWFSLGILKRHSPPAVLLRTLFTWTIKLNFIEVLVG